MASTLEPLLLRPPTPPRPSSYSFLPSKDPAKFRRPGESSPSDSPSSSAESLNHPGARKQKRVNFSPWTTYSSIDSDLRPQRSKVGGSTPLKSILKLRTSPSPTETPHSSPSPVDLPTMLGSVVQELAADAKPLHLDAYSVLATALKSYEGHPDVPSLAEHMPSLTQFIRRDICAKPAELGTVDGSIKQAAIRLLAIFVWKPEISNLLVDDFRYFVLDHCITGVEDPATPKAIVNQYMNVLSTQQFSTRAMTHDRAGRLLSALNNIATRVTGTNVLIQRQMIYMRLLYQAPTVMASRLNSWIEHLLSGLLSSVKVLRQRALRFGQQAALDLGTISSTSDAVQEFMNSETPEGVKHISFISDSLLEMIKSRNDREYVPVIWSMFLQFLRGRRKMVENWEHLKAWLHIAQKCFNCSGTPVDVQTHLAWRRLVRVIGPEKFTSRSMVRMLKQPIVSKFKHQSQREGQPINSNTFYCYCTLLYYAFRPGGSFQQLDIFWDEYVSDIFNESLLKSSVNVDQACRLLCALFWNQTSFMWKDDRADTKMVFEPEELPRLDSKWIRSKLSSILELCEHMFKIGTWAEDSRKPSDTSIEYLWTCLAKALGEACSKEVKPSIECKQGVALLCNTVKRICEGQEASLGFTEENSCDKFNERLEFLIKTMIANIGTIPFTEKVLTKSSKGLFIMATTPTHHSLSQSNTLQPPVFHLVQLISSNLNSSITCPPSHLRMLKEILAIVGEARPSLDSRLDFYLNLVEWSIEQSRLRTIEELSFRAIWQTAAELFHAAFANSPSDGRNLASEKECTKAIKILKAGIKFASDQAAGPVWSRLFRTTTLTLVEGKGRTTASLAMKDLLEILNDQEWFQSSNEDTLAVLRSEDSSPSSTINIRSETSSGDVLHRVRRAWQKKTSMSRTQDDSQILFTSVDSTKDTKPDPQKFTEHQLEVRDRQRCETGMTFGGDTRNTESQGRALVYDEDGLPPLNLTRSYDLEEELPSTPILQTHVNESDDAFLGSSPTPGSRKVTPVPEDIEIPSSPPSIPDTSPSGPDGRSSLLPPSLDQHVDVDACSNLEPLSNPSVSAVLTATPLGTWPEQRNNQAMPHQVLPLRAEEGTIMDSSTPLSTNTDKQDAPAVGQRNSGHTDVEDAGEAVLSQIVPEQAVRKEPSHPTNCSETDKLVLEGKGSAVTTGAPVSDEPLSIPEDCEAATNDMQASNNDSCDENRDSNVKDPLEGHVADVHDESRLQQSTSRPLTTEQNEDDHLIASQLEEELVRASSFDESDLPFQPLQTAEPTTELLQGSNKRKRSSPGISTETETKAKAPPRKRRKSQPVTSRMQTRSIRSRRSSSKEPENSRPSSLEKAMPTESNGANQGDDLDPINDSTTTDRMLDQLSSRSDSLTSNLPHSGNKADEAYASKPLLLIDSTENHQESFPTPPPSSPLAQAPTVTEQNVSQSEVKCSPLLGMAQPVEVGQSLAPDGGPESMMQATAILSDLRNALEKLKTTKIDIQTLRDIDVVLADIRLKTWQAAERK